MEREFLNHTFATDGVTSPDGPKESPRPDLTALRRRAEQGGSYRAWRDLGDALALWSGPGGIDEAIHAYTQALQAKPDDGDAHFRLGVCYRTRCESEHTLPGDFQTAVDHWLTARSLWPNEYIWRRCLEQYGPCLTKPYAFYDWVPTAIREIRARGVQPVELNVPPTGAEMAGPLRAWPAESGAAESPDSAGGVAQDTQGLVRAEVTVVPSRVPPGAAVRVHLLLRPNEARQVCWSDEGEPLRVWTVVPPGWQTQPPQLVAAPPERPARSRPQRVECDIRTATNANGPSRLIATALYRVREDGDGTYRLLRQDIPITVTAGK